MEKVNVKVCLGTTCFIMGSANLQELMEIVPERYGDKVDVSGVPCLGLCSADWEFSNAPYVKVADEIIKEVTVEKVLRAINEKLESSIASHKFTLDLANIMDDIREKIGLVYPFE